MSKLLLTRLAAEKWQEEEELLEEGLDLKNTGNTTNSSKI
jgi:hypothetical protein